jgi:uncharacterized membrane protein
MMQASCPQCGATIPDESEVCLECGEEVHAIVRTQGKVGVLPRKAAGAVAYCTIVPALIFLLLEPYKSDRFVRFHSLQCLGLWLSLFVVGFAMWIVGSVLGMIPMLAMLLLSTLIVLAAVVTWGLLIVKALLGESFKLPWIGELAER